MSYSKKTIKNLLTIAVIGAACCLTPAAAEAQIFVSVRIAPPVLPVYVQPPCPQPGYLWTPGYWAYGPMGYYWVPGVWVTPPRIGVLWTPGYWGFGGGLYGWHAGYWGPHVGFYGGVNYGFGYSGFGFGGGMWAGGAFRYNTAVMNVNTAVVRNVYVDRTVIHNTTIVNRASYNGAGGVMAQPSPQERAFEHEQHFQPQPVCTPGRRWPDGRKPGQSCTTKFAPTAITQSSARLCKATDPINWTHPCCSCRW